MIIDTHTHLWNEKTYNEYRDVAGGKIGKMIAIHYWKDYDGQGQPIGVRVEDVLALAARKKDLYVIASLDADKNIPAQLKKIEKLFSDPKMIGLKMYPGYQKFYPSDPKIEAVARLCAKHSKALVFHTGDFYDPENRAELKYSFPIHVDGLATKVPDCRIVISHFGFPHFLTAANVVSKNPNVFTDISGTIDYEGDKKQLAVLTGQYIKDLERVFAYFPDLKYKTMFGTDFGGLHTPLNQVKPYLAVVDKLFKGREKASVCYGLAKRVYGI